MYLYIYICIYIYLYIYTYIYIRVIIKPTSPLSYQHNGSVATDALGHILTFCAVIKSIE